MSRHADTEKALLARCLGGENEAWRDFISQYSPLVYYIIQKVLYSKTASVARGEIDDLHNDIFVSLMERDGRKLRQYKGKNGCSVSTWIRVISVRATIDYLRKKRDVLSLSDEDSRRMVEKNNHTADTPLQHLEDQEERRLLADIIEELPPKDKLFIRLFYYEGVAPSEIAVILKTTTNAVYSRGNYLREKIKGALRKKISKKQKQ